MGAEEVVVGDEQGGEGQGAVGGGKAAGGADVIFVSTIEAFDKLFEGAELRRGGFQILQTDYLSQRVGGLGSGSMSVEEVQAGLISGVAVGDEAQGLIGGQGAGSLAQGHGGGQGIALRGDVIGRDVMPLGVEKEESVWVLAGDPDIGFVAGGGVADRAFVAEVEGVAVISGGLGIVEDRLVAEGHAEDSAQDLGGLTGGEGKGDVEGQHQAQHVGRTVQAGEVDGGPVRSGRGELGRLKMVFAILIAQLELGGTELLQQLFVPVQGLLLLEVVRTTLARTFVEGTVDTLFPAEEGVATIGAPVRSLRRPMTTRDLRQAATDFATQLAGLAAIVAVEEVAGRAAVSATARGGQRIGAGTLNRRQRSAVLALVLNQQLPPIQSAAGRRGRLGQGGQGIDVEVAIVRMLLAKVVAGLRLGLTPGENRLQLLDQFLQILAGKFSAEPKHPSWYVAHGGESLGNLAGSLLGDMGKRDFTAFFAFRQVPRENYRRNRAPRNASPPQRSGLARQPPRGEKAKNPASPSNSIGYQLKEVKCLTEPGDP